MSSLSLSAHSLWELQLQESETLLTLEECSMLLDDDFLNDYDLLKTFPSAPKIESGVEYPASPSLYPPTPPSPHCPPSPDDSKPSPSQLANDLLQQLENSCKQENIFSNWLEEKVELPIFDNICPVEAPAAVPVPLPLSLSLPLVYQPTPAPAPAPAHTEDLLREFETIYGHVELTHLTPPQSPPRPATQLLVQYAQHAQCVPPAPAPAPLPLPAPAPHWADYERELQDVEELVRHRADQLSSPPSSPRSPHSPHSPATSSTDEEWGAPRRKPHTRAGPDDRRSRKKEQNKNAATRYRQKKKAEVEVLLQQEAGLRARHGDLGNKCSDLQREIRYLKGLMRDLFKAKGLIK